MKLREILRDPGLSGPTKQFVYYLEAQQYIHPEKVKRGQVQRREYSPDDLRVIKRMWAYHKSGVSPAKAFQLLSKAPTKIPKVHSQPLTILAFIFITYRPTIQADGLRTILEDLWKIPGVQEVAGVFGPVDILIKVEVENLTALYNLVHSKIPSIPGLKEIRTGTLIVIDPEFHWQSLREVDIAQETLAFILIENPINNTNELFFKLRELSEVLEVAVVYGQDADIVAKVIVKDLVDLTAFARQKLLTLHGIGKTSTYVVPDPDHYIKSPASERA